MDAVSKIHEFQRFGSILGLERMRVLMEKLGNPQEELKVIHVAGTNGKGSICKYIYEVLQAEGYKTGLYTSPFLEVFNERIEFDGKYISDDELNEYTDLVLEKSKEMVDEGKESPTEFEVITAIAMLYFKEKKADYAVLEVGLGGRGDSTNIVTKPLVSVIGSISLDHTDRLGDTIEDIAFEKSGIIKAECPVIVNTDNEEVRQIFIKRAAELNSHIYDVQELNYRITGERLEGYSFSTEIWGNEYKLSLSMPGRHQVQNALTALYALAVMERNGKISITGGTLSCGFRSAKQMGRFEIMAREPFVIIDGAHNPDGAAALNKTVKKYFTGKKILMVIGVLNDKSDDMLESFVNITKDFVVTEPENPRKIPAQQLAEKISSKGGKCIIMELPKDAVAYTETRHGDYDVILFAGSLYLIGEIRGLIRNDEKSNTVL